MGSGDALLLWQKPEALSYPEQNESSPYIPYHILETNFNIIFPPTPLSSKLFHSLRFPHQNPACTIPFTNTCTYPTHFIRLYLFTCVIFGGDYRSQSSWLCSLLHSPVTSPFLDQNTFLSIIFSKTLSIRSSLSVRVQVSRPCKTTGKIFK